MENKENEGKVVDVHVTSKDGLIYYTPVFADGSVGREEISEYGTDVSDIRGVMTQLRAKYGLPPEQ